MITQCPKCSSLHLETRERIFSNNTKHIELFCGSCFKHIQFITDKNDFERQIFFGKYKGKTYREIIETDPNYFAWLTTTGDRVALRIKQEQERNKE